MAKAKLNKGRFTLEEQKYIEKNKDKLPSAEIAEHLNRDKDSIIEYLARNANRASDVAEEIAQLGIRRNFQKSALYARLKKEFTADEVAYIEEGFCKMSAQFKEDILATEENQILKALKYEILMGRNLEQSNEFLDKAAYHKKRLEALRKKYKEIDDLRKNPEDWEYALSLEKAIESYKADAAAKTNEYCRLEEEHQKLMKDLNATRGQRVAKMESGKRDFIGMIRKLQQEDERISEAKQSEMMKIAVNKEIKRLGSPHEFPGGKDLPLLTPETVLHQDEEEEEDNEDDV